MTRPRSLHAARYLRTLATLEALSAIGNDDEVRRLLQGIDPLEARALAQELEASPLVSPPTGAARGIRSRRGLLVAPDPQELRA